MEFEARRVDWSQISYEVRLMINGPTTTTYSLTNLPIADDPGWTKWQKDGQTFRMINVHGPFLVSGLEDLNRCEDGWLVVEDTGRIFAVESEYVKPAGTSEIEERARPYGYQEV